MKWPTSRYEHWGKVAGDSARSGSVVKVGLTL